MAWMIHDTQFAHVCCSKEVDSWSLHLVGGGGGGMFMYVHDH